MSGGSGPSKIANASSTDSTMSRAVPVAAPTPSPLHRQPPLHQQRLVRLPHNHDPHMRFSNAHNHLLFASLAKVYNNNENK